MKGHTSGSERTQALDIPSVQGTRGSSTRQGRSVDADEISLNQTIRQRLSNASNTRSLWNRPSRVTRLGGLGHSPIAATDHAPPILVEVVLERLAQEIERTATKVTIEHRIERVEGALQAWLAGGLLLQASKEREEASRPIPQQFSRVAHQRSSYRKPMQP
ncbi:MAG: hypothetical protein ACTHL8_11195 [Burkholderiaceae bacterium]